MEIHQLMQIRLRRVDYDFFRMIVTESWKSLKKCR